MKKHFIELDSLRGLAAMTVVIGHFLLIYPFAEPDTFGQSEYGIWNIFKYSPLHITWAGHEAVILFFMLSGFVLSLPYYKDDFQINIKWYKGYMIKRFTRIYIPYAFAVMLGVILILILKPSVITGASDFVNRIWTREITVLDIINHLFLIGDFNTTNINPVIWSLVHEMRISIIFPVLMLIVLKFKSNISVLIAMAISFFSLLTTFLLGNSGSTSLLITVHYSSIFLVGALLAKNIELLVTKVKSLNKYILLGLVILASVTYTYKWVFYNISVIHNSVINDWAVILGSALIIILSLSTNSFSNFLRLKPIHYLGKISYSLYLYHILALFTVIHLIDDYSEKPVIFIFGFIISIALSIISYHLIEIPSIKLGKKLTSKRVANKSTSKIKTKAV